VQALCEGATVQVDASEATRVDGAVVALLMLIDGRQRHGPRVLLRPEALPAAVRGALRRCGAEFLCEPPAPRARTGEEQRAAH